MKKIKWFFKNPIRVFSSFTILLFLSMLCAVTYYLTWWAIPVWIIFGGGGLLVYFSVFLPREAMLTRDWRVFLKGYIPAIKEFWEYYKA